MTSFDIVRMGLKNLWRRKLRTFLTILGVIIGTTSIVVMVSLGIGMNETFKQQIESMGSLTVIQVQRGWHETESGMMQDSSVKLDDETVAVMAEIPGVEVATPIMHSYAKFVAGRYAADISIIGILPQAMEALDLSAARGRLLQEGDELDVVFGNYAQYQFYKMGKRNNRGFYGGMRGEGEPEVDVMESSLKLTFDWSYGERRASSGSNEKRPKLYRLNCVGVLEDVQNEYSYSVVMNIEQLKQLQEENNRSNEAVAIHDVKHRSNRKQDDRGYDRAMVKVHDMDDVKRVQEQIKAMGFEAYSLTDILDNMQESTATLRAILGGIGAVSLLVAAIGITNTMVMSIYERTREIGIMKVIGATLRDIRRIFLFEAGMIGLLGGLFGLGFSFLISHFMNTSGLSLFGRYGPGGPGAQMSIIPPWLALSTLAFASVIGLISGYYPARRAMKLSALEAIKTD